MKAFTLVELIGVIVLLGVIALIVVPLINNNIVSSKTQAKEQQIATIKEAALIYSIKNDLGKETNEKKLTLDELVTGGFLNEEDIYLDDVKLSGCVIYFWQTNINNYNFRYDETCS